MRGISKWQVLVYVRDLPNQRPALRYATTMVPGQHAWNPKEAGTKMVTLGTIGRKTVLRVCDGNGCTSCTVPG